MRYVQMYEPAPRAAGVSPFASAFASPAVAAPLSDVRVGRGRGAVGNGGMGWVWEWQGVWIRMRTAAARGGGKLGRDLRLLRNVGM